MDNLLPFVKTGSLLDADGQATDDQAQRMPQAVFSLYRPMAQAASFAMAEGA